MSPIFCPWLQIYEKFPPAKIGDIVKVHIPDVVLGRCVLRNLSVERVEVDSSKCFCEIGTTEEKVEFALRSKSVLHFHRKNCKYYYVRSFKWILLGECTRKFSLSSGQSWKRYLCMTACRNNSCSCRKISQYNNSLFCSNKERMI